MRAPPPMPAGLPGRRHLGVRTDGTPPPRIHRQLAAPNGGGEREASAGAVGTTAGGWLRTWNLIVTRASTVTAVLRDTKPTGRTAGARLPKAALSLLRCCRACMAAGGFDPSMGVQTSCPGTWAALVGGREGLVVGEASAQALPRARARCQCTRRKDCTHSVRYECAGGCRAPGGRWRRPLPTCGVPALRGARHHRHHSSTLTAPDNCDTQDHTALPPGPHISRQSRLPRAPRRCLPPPCSPLPPAPAPHTAAAAPAPRTAPPG